MRRKYKGRIKKLIINEVVYKIYNKKDNKFKESGAITRLTNVGGTWYRIGDVKKAYNLIPDDDKKDYIIVKIKNKVKELEQIDY